MSPTYHFFAWANYKIYKLIYNRSLFLAHISHEQANLSTEQPPCMCPFKTQLAESPPSSKVTPKGDLTSLLDPDCRGEETESMVLSVFCVGLGVLPITSTCMHLAKKSAEHRNGKEPGEFSVALCRERRGKYRFW